MAGLSFDADESSSEGHNTSNSRHASRGRSRHRTGGDITEEEGEQYDDADEDDDDDAVVVDDDAVDWGKTAAWVHPDTANLENRGGGTSGPRL
mmetsp:Transcript_32761/g.97749  ORF Transcript_32761/g.97749 Transcript_32761/m.97749 type:complete len:93 (-) Transcript_32761:45-323(-)